MFCCAVSTGFQEQESQQHSSDATVLKEKYFKKFPHSSIRTFKSFITCLEKEILVCILRQKALIYFGISVKTAKLHFSLGLV